MFWKFANNASETEDGETPASGSRLLFTRGYAVFNAAQVDGYTPKAEPAVSMPERIERAETWFQSIGADVSQRRKPRVLCAWHGSYPDAAVCRVRRKRPVLFDAGT